jgi:hypothetical protein
MPPDLMFLVVTYESPVFGFIVVLIDPSPQLFELTVYEVVPWPEMYVRLPLLPHVTVHSFGRLLSVYVAEVQTLEGFDNEK